MGIFFWGIMDNIKKILTLINNRIQQIYEDIIILSSSGKIIFNMKDDEEKVHSLFYKVSTEQASLTINRITLNICMILDEDDETANLIKIMNKIQATPKAYNLDSSGANRWYTRLIVLLHDMRNDEVFVTFKEFRDKIVAHNDIKSIGKTFTIPDRLYPYFKVLVELTNFLFALFGLPENDFQYYVKSSLEQLFDECSTSSSKKFI